MKQLRAKVWVLVPLLIVASSAFLAWQIVQKEGTVEAAECVDSRAQDFSCWQRHYTVLVTDQSPEAAFADFRKNYETNPYIKSNCHQVAHVIGRAAAKKYSTLAETYKHGDNFCWSGYYHGSIETVAAKLGPEKILSQINNVCADFLKAKAYGFDHYNCVHGMGHGLMAVQGDNLFQALESCDKFEGSWQQSSCYSGVFMENVMNEVNPGEHSNYLKADDPLYPCTAVADKYKQQCYFMQTSHALTVVQNDYTKVFALCAGLTAPYDTTCYQSLGRDVSGQSSSNPARTVELCMLGSTYAAQENCFTGAVKDFISYHHSDTQGLAMCAMIPEPTLAASCKEQATTYYKTF